MDEEEDYYNNSSRLFTLYESKTERTFELKWFINQYPYRVIPQIILYKTGTYYICRILNFVSRVSTMMAELDLASSDWYLDNSNFSIYFKTVEAMMAFKLRFDDGKLLQ